MKIDLSYLIIIQKSQLDMLDLLIKKLRNRLK